MNSFEDNSHAKTAFISFFFGCAVTTLFTLAPVEPSKETAIPVEPIGHSYAFSTTPIPEGRYGPAF